MLSVFMERYKGVFSLVLEGVLWEKKEFKLRFKDVLKFLVFWEVIKIIY